MYLLGSFILLLVADNVTVVMCRALASGQYVWNVLEVGVSGES